MSSSRSPAPSSAGAWSFASPCSKAARSSSAPATSFDSRWSRYASASANPAGGIHERRAGEARPGGLDVVAQAPRAAAREDRLEDRAQAPDPIAAVRREAGEPRFVAHRLDQGLAGGTIPARRGEHVQVREREPAPRRPRERDPRGPVGGMGQGARESEQVAHDGTGSERIDLDGAKAKSPRLEGRHHPREGRAGAHEDRDGTGQRGVGPGIGQGFLGEPGDAGRLGVGLVVEEGMDRHRVRKRLVHGDGRAIGDGAGRDVLRRGHHPREGVVHPGDDAGPGTEVRLQPQRFEGGPAPSPSRWARRNRPTSASRKR
jgi:hypothetical protein